MKRLMIPMIISLYLMQICFIIYFAGDDTLFRMAYIGLAFSAVSAILAIFNFAFALLKKNTDEKSVYKLTMITKIVLIPFYVISFFFAAIIIISGVVVIFFVIPFFVISFIIWIFTYIVLVTSGIYNVVFLFRQRGKKDIVYLGIHIVLHFLFIADLVDSIVLYSTAKKKNLIIE